MVIDVNTNTFKVMIKKLFLNIFKKLKKNQLKNL